jgi:hypothetical protein
MGLDLRPGLLTRKPHIRHTPDSFECIVRIALPAFRAQGHPVSGMNRQSSAEQQTFRS